MSNFGSGGDDYQRRKPPPSWRTQTRRRIEYEMEEIADRQRKAREAEEQELKRQKQQNEREAQRAGQSPQEQFARDLLSRPSRQLPATSQPVESPLLRQPERVERRFRVPKLVWISALLLLLFALAYYKYPEMPFEPQQVRGLRLGAATLADVEAVLAARGEMIIERRTGSLVAIKTRTGGAQSVTYAVEPEADRLISIVVRTLHSRSADSALRVMTWTHLFDSRLVHWSDNTRVFWKPGLRIMIFRDDAELIEMYSARQ